MLGALSVSVCKQLAPFDNQLDEVPNGHLVVDRLLALELGIQPVCLGQLLALVRWVFTTEQR